MVQHTSASDLLNNRSSHKTKYELMLHVIFELAAPAVKHVLKQLILQLSVIQMNIWYWMSFPQWIVEIWCNLHETCGAHLFRSDVNETEYTNDSYMKGVSFLSSSSRSILAECRGCLIKRECLLPLISSSPFYLIYLKLLFLNSAPRF